MMMMTGLLLLLLLPASSLWISFEFCENKQEKWGSILFTMGQRLKMTALSTLFAHIDNWIRINDNHHSVMFQYPIDYN